MTNWFNSRSEGCLRLRALSRPRAKCVHSWNAGESYWQLFKNSFRLPYIECNMRVVAGVARWPPREALHRTRSHILEQDTPTLHSLPEPSIILTFYFCTKYPSYQRPHNKPKEAVHWKLQAEQPRFGGFGFLVCRSRVRPRLYGSCFQLLVSEALEFYGRGCGLRVNSSWPGTAQA